jgi:hypothetical protein
LTHYGVARDDFYLVPARGKGYACNAATWNNIRISNPSHSNLYNLIKQDSGRSSFQGIILIVDSDMSNDDAFNQYKRNEGLLYADKNPIIKREGVYWYIDALDGVRKIPIYGINVPVNTTGCLETDLLDAYGFPVEGQPEYANVADAIKKASVYWKIPPHGDGKDWWAENEKAKLDKFIYSAFSHGFEISGEEPMLPAEPNVIKNIKMTIGIQ